MGEYHQIASQEKSTMADMEKIHHLVKLVFKKNCHNMLKMEIFDLESLHNVSVVMIFSFQKLSLWGFFTTEYIIMLQV